MTGDHSSPRQFPVWLPYVAPFTLFMLATAAECVLPRAAYTIYYALKIAVVGAVLFGLRGSYAEARPNAKGLLIGVPVGVVLTAAWVAIDHVTPHFAILGHRTALDPLARFAGTQWLLPFLAVRFAGLVVVVPLLEELFWRGFLLRFIARPADFQSLPLGACDALSFAAVVALMAATHPEWLAAAVFSAVLNVLLIRSKNLFVCIATHAVTNLTLGVYVLLTHSWQYW